MRAQQKPTRSTKTTDAPLLPNADVCPGRSAKKATADVVFFRQVGTHATIPRVLARALESALASGHPGALAVLRMGEYRMIEETFGHKAAKELRALVEERVRRVLRIGDALIPLPHDELALLLEGCDSPEAVAQVAARVIADCCRVYALEPLRLHTSIHLGIARYPSDGTEPSKLLRSARIALHETNDPSAEPFLFFSHDLLTKVRERIWLAAEIDGALAEGRLELHYQPMFAMDTRQTIEAEALLRLRSTTGELIPPARFIPLAERSGLIVSIGAWVLHRACAQLAEWRRAGIGPLRIAVNVSPRQLTEQSFAATVDAAVAAAGIAHRDLVLEITENQVVDQLPLVENTLSTLSAKGIRFAVDDFGTGYSALTYLARLPLSSVKVDRTLLHSVPEDERAMRLLTAVIAMARGLDMEITAEGVETEAQFRCLAAAGCHLGQGFGYAYPQGAASFARSLLKVPPWGPEKQ